MNAAVSLFRLGEIEETLADDALLALFKLRDRLVQRNANTAACRVDEIMETFADFMRGALLGAAQVREER